VVLPSSQKSWIGAAYQIRDVIKGQYYYPREPDGNGETSPTPRPLKEGEVGEWVLLDATPASCANIAIHNLYPGEVDLLISGPNLGRNTSSAFSISSGTIGAALSSSLCKTRSIALSYGTMIHPIPRSFNEPAYKLSGRIINYLLKNWHQEAVLYSINIPMIQSLLESNDLKIYWTGFWRNSHSRLFKETKVPTGAPEVKGTGSSPAGDMPVKEGKAAGELAFKFSPSLDGILNAEAAPAGSDAWALSQGAVSVTVLQAGFAELPSEQSRTVADRLWKMKL